MGAGLLDKSNSQTRLHSESPFLWDQGGIVPGPSLRLTFASFPWVVEFPGSYSGPQANKVPAGLPTSLSDTSESLNEVREVQRDFSGCVILDFFSKNACHFATFQWKNSHWLCLKMQNKIKNQGNFTRKYEAMETYGGNTGGLFFSFMVLN